MPNASSITDDPVATITTADMLTDAGVKPPLRAWSMSDPNLRSRLDASCREAVGPPAVAVTALSRTGVS